MPLLRAQSLPCQAQPCVCVCTLCGRGAALSFTLDDVRYRYLSKCTYYGAPVCQPAYDCVDGALAPFCKPRPVQAPPYAAYLALAGGMLALLVAAVLLLGRWALLLRRELLEGRYGTRTAVLLLCRPPSTCSRTIARQWRTRHCAVA